MMLSSSKWDAFEISELAESSEIASSPCSFPNGRGRGKKKSILVDHLQIPFQALQLKSPSGVHQLASGSCDVGGRGRQLLTGHKVLTQNLNVDKKLQESHLPVKQSCQLSESDWPSLSRGCNHADFMGSSGDAMLESCSGAQPSAREGGSCVNYRVEVKDFDADTGRLFVRSCDASEPGFLSAFDNGTSWNTTDLSDFNFLRLLNNRDHYLLIQNLPLGAPEKEVVELVSGFGKVCSFTTQSDNIKKKALIQMDSSSTCQWVLSCLDGSRFSDDSEPLEVLLVDDVCTPCRAVVEPH